MAVRRFSLGLMFAALAALGPIACGSGASDLTRVAVIGTEPKLVETVSVPLTAGEALIRSNVAQGLVRFDERGQVVPGLAERWNVSDDGLSYIFRLQTGEWPDGRKIKADEVARIISRQLRPSSKNPLKDTLGAVREIVAMTDRVIEIRLNAPRPNLLQLLAQPEFGLVRASVGTGPFQPATAEQIAPLPAELKKLPGIFLAHRIRIPDAEDPVEKIHLSGGDAQKLIAAFANGDLELLLGGTVGDLPYAFMAKLPRGARRFDPVAGLFGLAPTGRREALKERDVRRLLSTAIDRDALIAGLHVNGLQPRATILQSGLEGVGAPQQPAWIAQPVIERRQALVAEARRLFGKVELPNLRILLPAGPGGDYLLARLRYDWGPLGIRVDRAPTLASADLVWIDEVAPSSSPAWFLRRFRCDMVPVCLEDADPLLDQARLTPDSAQRAQLFLEAARMMDDAQLFIPIAAPIRWSLVSGRAPGFEENPFARHTLVGLAEIGNSGGLR
ncbi:ABC transporter substrate-binding protein [Sphingomonas sp. NSE70-1]|uniref:ABC transporter substrate-binding protein n=1 Tax=Sphingomonas caseinilyticus TaxID=2908205 RepID=A0ABT0RXK9_9SPHN|nr:ABC transporter substrate-binding protein [Sphingomonas caseinilyticus]MCL6699701.1 ABC transporter substrate-binding protein [Sphingomonas caseinilyticus]